MKSRVILFLILVVLQSYASVGQDVVLDQGELLPTPIHDEQRPESSSNEQRMTASENADAQEFKDSIVDMMSTLESLIADVNAVPQISVNEESIDEVKDLRDDVLPASTDDFQSHASGTDINHRPTVDDERDLIADPIAEIVEHEHLHHVEEEEVLEMIFDYTGGDSSVATPNEEIATQQVSPVSSEPGGVEDVTQGDIVGDSSSEPQPPVQEEKSDIISPVTESQDNAAPEVLGEVGEEVSAQPAEIVTPIVEPDAVMQVNLDSSGQGAGDVMLQASEEASLHFEFESADLAEVIPDSQSIPVVDEPSSRDEVVSSLLAESSSSEETIQASHSTELTEVPQDTDVPSIESAVSLIGEVEPVVEPEADHQQYAEVVVVEDVESSAQPNHEEAKTATTEAPSDPVVSHASADADSSFQVTMLQQRIAALTATNDLLMEEIQHLKDQLNMSVEPPVDDSVVQCECADCQALLATEKARLQQEAEQQYQQCAESLANVTHRLAVTERNVSAIDVKLKLAKNEVTMSRLTIENCALTREMVQMECNENRTALEAELVALRRDNKALLAGKGSAAATTAACPCNAGSATAAGGGGGGGGGQRSSFFGTFDRSSASSGAAVKAESSTSASGSSNAASSMATSTGALFESPHKARVPVEPVHASRQDSASDSQLKSVVQQLQSTLQHLLGTYLGPAVSQLLQMRLKLAKLVLGGVWVALSTVWGSALSPLYESTLQPALTSLYSTQVLPLYTAQVAPTVNATVDSVVSWWTSSGWDVVYEQSAAPWVDEIILHLHRLFYFTVKFFSSEDMLGATVRLAIDMHDKIGELVSLLHGVPSVRSVLGSPSTVYLVVMALILVSVGGLLYYFRRIVKSLVAMALLLLLLPLLLVLLVLAKLWALVVPGGQKPQSGQKKSSGKKKQHNYGGAAATAVSAPSAAVPTPTSAAVPPTTSTEEFRPPASRTAYDESVVAPAAGAGGFSHTAHYEAREPAVFPAQQQYQYQSPPSLHQPQQFEQQYQPPRQQQQQQQLHEPIQKSQSYPAQRPSESYDYGYSAPFSPAGPPPATNRSLPSPFAQRGSRGTASHFSSSASVGSVHSQYQQPPPTAPQQQQQQQQAPLQSSPEGPPPTGGYNNLPGAPPTASTSPVNSGYMVTDHDLDYA